MIEYSQEEWVNYFVPAYSAAILSVLFCQNYKKTVGSIESFLMKHKDITPENVKESKENCEIIWKEAISGEDVQDSDIAAILAVEGRNQYSLNLIHSLTRIPEWFMFTESYLNQVYAPDMVNRLQDINAICMDETVFPYNKEIGLSNDIYMDFDKQEASVTKFIKQMDVKDPIALKRCTKKSIKEAMKQIEKWIYGPIDAVPKYAQSWVSMIKDIRMNVGRLNRNLNRVIKEGFDVKDLTLSESICYLNDEEYFKNIAINILQWQGKDGKGKISALIGNIFHLYYKGVPIPKTDGQIDLYNIGMDMLFSKAAPGLGPAYKIRIVYSTSSEIQNYSEIFASFLKKFHLNCYHHAYLAQTDYILSHAHLFSDVQCTDCTGYSDYLNRNIYRWLMTLMGISPIHIEIMMRILAMPVKVNDKIFPVPFGALQGVKFLVYIMNDANAVIGLIQNILRVNQWTDRQNAGDDVYAATREGSFSSTDLTIDIYVWLWFNCPTNMSKSAWLKRDHYWDFCKVFFTHNGLAVTGLPPKMYNKEVLSIRDISEIYKNFDRSGVEPLRPIEEFVDILEPFLRLKWKEGMNLYNPISKLGMEEKIKVAKGISYKIGGLSSTDPSDEERINHLIEYCYKLFYEYDLNVGDIYTWAINKGFTGIIKSFLLQVKSARAIDFLNYIKRLEDILGAYQEGYVYTQDIEDIESDLESMTRIFLDSGKVSASGSTYHRLTPTRSGDTTLITHRNFIQEGLDIPYKMPDSVFDTIALARIAADVEKANIARLNEYAVVTQLYDFYTEKGLIEWGGGGYNQNFGVYAYIRDKEQNCRFRLYSVSDDTFRNDIYPEYYCKDTKMRAFIQTCKKYQLMEGTFKADSLLKEIGERIAREILEEVSKDYAQCRRVIIGSQEEIQKEKEKSENIAKSVIARYKGKINS